MEDKRKNNGGHKTNGGRHTKADELKVNELFNKALKVLYKQDTDEDNKVNFIVDYYIHKEVKSLLLSIYSVKQKIQLKQH